MIRSVLFDIGGVLVSSPVKTLRRYERTLGLPDLFFARLIRDSGDDGSFARLERGEVVMSRFLRDFQQEVDERIGERAQRVDVQQLWREMTLVEPVPEMFAAARALRLAGFRTGVLTNNWIDDVYVERRADESRFMSGLALFFDEVVESCRVGVRKPDSTIFEVACTRLGTAPAETLFLDDLLHNVRGAEAAGLQAMHVKSPAQSSVELLQRLNIPATLAPLPRATPGTFMGVYPPPIRPSDVQYSSVPVHGGRLHYAELGSGPRTIILAHGFPDTHLTWRHVMPALALAGHRVIAVDMAGYGASAALGDRDGDASCALERIVDDFRALLNAIGVPRATFIGHDWGGASVLAMAQACPSRVAGVASICTPFLPAPTSDPLPRMHARPGRFDYQLYLMDDASVHELQANVRRTLSVMLRGYDESLPTEGDVSTGNVRARGGFLVGFPAEPSVPRILSDGGLDCTALDEYERLFRQSGFLGAARYYRNVTRNWQFLRKIRNASDQLTVPTLMVTAGRDTVLPPAAAKDMERYCPQLTRAHIEHTGHWVQMEQPQELCGALLSWIASLDAADVCPSKL